MPTLILTTSRPHPYQRSYRWESHVIEFFAIGTAVAPLQKEIDAKDIPAPTLVLSVND
ncbi:hypothetical protein [Paraburkholderia sp. BCC1886]|uniref:hypothetical protein n=1 Tax=Paraburkholderia sp. BCC1886 TaxID=2562670 RepID=UPI001642645C|nr:hypothetical protein [Paraburkholderia sp. BCC1886]